MPEKNKLSKSAKTIVIRHMEMARETGQRLTELALLDIN
jgi:hypothetical protein